MSGKVSQLELKKLATLSPLSIHIWLVAYLPLWKYEFVSWGYYSQYMEIHKSHVWNHQPDMRRSACSLANHIDLKKVKKGNPWHHHHWPNCASPGTWINIRANVSASASVLCEANVEPSPSHVSKFYGWNWYHPSNGRLMGLSFLQYDIFHKSFVDYGKTTPSHCVQMVGNPSCSC